MEQRELSSQSNGPVHHHGCRHHRRHCLQGTINRAAWTVHLIEWSCWPSCSLSSSPMAIQWNSMNCPSVHPIQWSCWHALARSTVASVGWVGRINNRFSRTQPTTSRDSLKPASQCFFFYFVPSATIKSSTPFRKFSLSPMSKSKNKLHKAENTPPPRPSVFSFHCWSWQSYLL